MDNAAKESQTDIEVRKMECIAFKVILLVHFFSQEDRTENTRRKVKSVLGISVNIMIAQCYSLPFFPYLSLTLSVYVCVCVCLTNDNSPSGCVKSLFRKPTHISGNNSFRV